MPDPNKDSIGPSKEIQDRINKIYEEDAKKKYENYIRQHTGNKIDKSDPDKRIETLSKVMAAILLSDTKTTNFSKKLIDITADKLKRTLYLKDKTTTSQIRDALMSKEAAKDLMDTQLVNYYNPVNGRGLIEDMKKLFDNMMSSKDRSPEYKAMVKSVKRIADMDPAKLSTIQGQNYIIDANATLMRRIDTYMKGKKKVRRTDDGKERFNNSLDALAILDKYVPGAHDMALELVGRINSVRNADNEKNKNYVDLDNFGPKRAEAAKAARQAKQQKKAETVKNPVHK